MTSVVVGSCWSCTRGLTALEYGRGDSCPTCGRDTRVCKGCFFYDPKYNNECRENQADRVVEKERSNFCDYFKPTMSKTGNSVDPAAAAKAAAEALFKKK
ncbi:MAG: hypothetical protein HYX41_01675 [Bdellovibrio sp.]|nr:hypothetical protein [Bdellovibrio sp.]